MQSYFKFHLPYHKVIVQAEPHFSWLFLETATVTKHCATLIICAKLFQNPSMHDKVIDWKSFFLFLVTVTLNY